MEMDTLCHYLAWDSDFFGLRIGRVNASQLNDEWINKINCWSLENNINCLYFLTEATDGGSIRVAENEGFHLVDIRVVFEKQKLNPSSGNNGFPSGVRPSTQNDIPGLRSIAKTSFRNATRFYYDLNFPRDLCDALYETWIEKSCNGYADIVLVSENEGQPSGFITCKRIDQTHGEIGLVGVSPRWQGIGLGQELINESLRWFIKSGITHVKVTTQGRNSQAQRLYQRIGFLTVSVELWYHKWFHQEIKFK